MTRTVLLSTTALLIGATAAFAHPNVTSTKLGNGFTVSTITRHQAPQHFVAPHMLVAFDATNLATKDTKGEYTPWEAYITCGSAATGSFCGKESWAFPFTSGATLALAKLGGYQLGIQVPSSGICGAGAAASVSVSLYTNAGGVPGAPIAGSTVTMTATGTWGTYSPPIQKLLKKAVQLTISTPYWMVISPGSGNTCVAFDVQDFDYVTPQPLAFSASTPTTWTPSTFGPNFVPAYGVVR